MAKAAFPAGFAELAKVYASHTHQIGDKASIILAQAALESGWFTSKLWKEGNNPFGIQAAMHPDNRKYQTSATVYLKGGVPHAGYLVVVDAFRDRERVIKQHAKQHPGKTIWERFELSWAPRDPRYPSNEGYSAKLKKIIEEHQLERFDTAHPPPREDLNPSEPYKPTDPRDTYHNLPGINSDRPRPGLPYWLVVLGLVVSAFLAGSVSGTSWVGILIEVLKRLVG